MSMTDRGASLSGAVQVAVPGFVRIKPGAIGRLGLYLRRHEHLRVAVLTSEGLPDRLLEAVRGGLASSGIDAVANVSVAQASFESAADTFRGLPASVDAILGIGGGRAVDAAKFIAHLAHKPFYAVPTSLSNDGFASPQASLTVAGRRRSLATAPPAAVVVDTDVCLAAPKELWLSGVGDLVAKLTAVRDWKTAYHETGEPVNDFACLLSDASVHQFLSRPTHDTQGLRLLATALLQSGVAMALCGSSRPASGSEHLVSHALDELSPRPRLHGLQVGLASYIVSRLQHGEPQSELIAALFDATGFWDAIRKDPFDRQEWLEAFRRAPAVKPDRYTVLSKADRVPEVVRLIDEDPALRGCFADT